MPRVSQTRRASSTSLGEPQQPKPVSSLGSSLMVTPTASCPERATSAAATELSTPPLIATTTRAIKLGRIRAAGTAELLHRLRQHGEEALDVRFRGTPADRDAQTTRQEFGWYAHRFEHVGTRVGD